MAGNAHRRTKQTFKDANYVDYGYDELGQLTSAIGKETSGTSRLHEQLSYTYDAAGNAASRNNNGLAQNFTHNNLNQINGTSRTGTTITVAGSVGVNSPSTTPPSAITVQVNGTAAVTPYSDYTFAKAGLSIGSTYTAVATGGGRSDTHQITVNLPASISPSYDTNGNLLEDDKRTFEYDHENQLTAVQVAAQWRTEFVYDGLGRCRIKREKLWNGSSFTLTGETRYLYDGRLVVQERDGNNLPGVSYTRGVDLSGSLQGAGGIGGLLARTEHGLYAIDPTKGHVFYHADGNGNVTALVNDKQVVVAKYSYDPFGNILSKSGLLADANVYRFSSKEYHQGSGLYYYGFRFYDPNLQRWLNRDPIEEAGGINLYGFVGNNPINYVDPDGQVAVLVLLAGAWVVIEVGLEIYDYYDTARTLLDPCESSFNKGVSVAGLAAGTFLPGGGYGPLIKKLASQRAARRAAQRFAGMGNNGPQVRLPDKPLAPGSQAPTGAPGVRTEIRDPYTGNVVHHDPYGHKFTDGSTIPPHYGVDTPEGTIHFTYPTAHDPSRNR